MAPGVLGAITSPRQRSRIAPGWDWAGDNGCYGAGWLGDPAFFRWLARMKPRADRCLFINAPDVVCDAAATLKRSAPYLEAIRAMGYPVSFTLQNGVTRALVPWDDCDGLFIGGDDDFKGCAVVRDLVSEGRARGMHVHMGRVNTFRRLKMAAAMGCDTGDGQTMARFPATFEQMMRWLGDGRVQQQLLW